MAINPTQGQLPKPQSSIMRWLLDSDPAIRWQVMRDLTDAPAGEVAAERARVATEGMGARTRALTVIICGLFDEAWLLEIEVVAAA